MRAIFLQEETFKALQNRIDTMLPILNEYQRRIYLASEATSIGKGGQKIVSQLARVSQGTIKRGERTASHPPQESHDQVPPPVVQRIRKSGGGRKKLSLLYPDLLDKIEEIVRPHTMGDPMRPLKWSSKSSRKITKELNNQGYTICHETVRSCMKVLNYSLQSNKKTKEGCDSPDRNGQFEFIDKKITEFTRKRLPVISIDCKKKELIGDYKNQGREWSPVKSPTEVNVYDFVDKTNGKANPYGVFDINNNRGWVNVGISSDTASFAVNSIREWWNNDGKLLYPDSKSLFITADGGGSNASRSRLWKYELQKFSDETGMSIHVSHYPPGTSKWNKIEHKLFSYITINWRAKPITSLNVILNLISETTTEAGLSVSARLDETVYEKGIKITDQEMATLKITKCDFCPNWNYIIEPRF